MALAGSITQLFQTYWQLVLEWSATQSIANNTSTITANLYLQSFGGTISSSANKTAHINIDGTTYTKNDVNINLSRDQKKLLFTATRTISHNPDGTKTFTLSGDCQINATLDGVYVGTVYLPQISFTLNTIRASSISSFPNFTIGSPFTVTISRHSDTFTHKLTLKAGSVVVKEVTGVGTSYQFNLTTAEQDKIYQTIPNSTSRTMTLVCQTYSGSTPVGSAVSKTATASVPSSVVPDFDTILHSDSNVSTNIVGRYIQGLSQLSLEITGATGAKYSTITSYQITFEGKNYNSRTATIDAIKGSGNLTITGKVTDSRGRTATKSVTVNVLPYSAPVITKFTLARCNADGTPNDMGTFVKVVCKGSIVSLINETERNALTYRIKTSSRGASAWEIQVEQTITGLNLDVTHVVGEFSAASSCDFRLEIADKFFTASAEDILPLGTVTMSWGKYGVGIGKVWERGALDVLGEIFCNDGEMDGLVPVVESGSNDNGSYVRWSNGLQICWGSKTIPGEGWSGSGDKRYLTGQSLKFPATFDSDPIFLGTTQDAQIGARSAKLTNFNAQTSSVSNIAFSGWGTAPNSFYLRWLAIGWWKELEES